MKEFDKIIKYYEDIKVYDADITGDKLCFIAKSSIHSGVTTFAYGKALERQCVDVVKAGNVTAKITLAEKDIKTRRFFLKITACLVDWQKYENDIKISINGETIANGRSFFENVNLGWPSLYFAVKKGVIKSGENIIEVQSKDETGAGLLLSVVRIVTLPEFKRGTQISALKSVKKGKDYAIAVYGVKDVKPVSVKNCEFTGATFTDELKDTVLLKFKTTKEGKAKCVCLADGQKINLYLPECFNGEDEFLVGTDSDDHRHDDSTETDEIIKIFAFSGMGDYFQFRPQYGRNYVELSDKETWKRRIEFLKDFDITVGVCDCDRVMPFVDELAGKKFLGGHIHEPYLFFYRDLPIASPEQAKQYFVDCDTLDRSEYFSQSKREYLLSLDKTYDKYARGAKGLSSVGSPSLLCVYEADKFDRVTIEPVSGISLLVSAVRGTVGESGFWGAHVPVDWYFGAPNNKVKSGKFLTAMLYLYMNGAKYVYTENAVFKTNAFSREDMESTFCVLNRKYLRSFYDYTVKNPRKGEIKRDLAIIYGNNDFFMWQTDERIAELGENDDWDQNMWGKWQDSRSHHYWRAAEEWFPYAENQNSVNDALNLRLFAGNPYGGVDIVPYRKDYSKYKAVVFLGWNTYENGFTDKLWKFAKNGGTAFVSYCHFNNTDRPDKEFRYEGGDGVGKLVGCKLGGIEELADEINLDGEKITADMPVKIADCKPISAQVVATDGAGKPIITVNRIGKGKIYFCSVADYYKSDAIVKLFKRVLKRIAKETSEIFCDNGNIAITERINGDTRALSFLNLSCANEKSQKFSVKIKTDGKVKTIHAKLAPFNIKTINLSK